jgi:hypothetical protein
MRMISQQPPGRFQADSRQGGQQDRARVRVAEIAGPLAGH